MFHSDAKRNAAALADAYTNLRQRILGKDTPFAAVEAYKSMRTNLQFMRVGTGCQKIVFTSVFPHEGKTINCLNMAISMAQAGQKVLLIDADMRKPMIHRILDLNNHDGFSEILAGLVSEGEGQSIHLKRTAFENLHVIPAGRTPPNPAELLASEAMERLLEKLSAHYDYIFIDSPPVSIVTDAAVLSKLVEGFVLVVRTGMTPIEELRSVVSRLEQLGANLLGFILNDADSNRGAYSYYRKRYKYYRRYGYNKYGRKQYGYAKAPADYLSMGYEESVDRPADVPTKSGAV